MKKCIVLDLDNTLWGGIVGEDGLDGIQLSLEAPGNSFIAFQQTLLDLYNRGIILAVNSQNNYEDAMNVIRTHPNMILKEPHFAAFRINWNDKAQNLRELAEELNIGLDSMVFFDDMPMNRELVRSLLPEVEVPELPVDPVGYTKLLLSLPYFAIEAVTDEDAMRGNLYVTERLRKETEKQFTDKHEFLKSLGLELNVHVNDRLALARIAQLTEKTNQFNTNKKPMSIEEVEAYMDDPSKQIFHAQLTDCFGDYGIIAVAFVEMQGDTWNLKSMLMSCRVFGRGVENAFLYCIAEEAKKYKALSLSIAFEPTEKNVPAKEFVNSVFQDRAIKVYDVHAPDWITITL